MNHGRRGMYLIGMRIAAVVCLLVLPVAADDVPPAPGVTVEVRAETAEFALGDPIRLALVYRNAGQGAWEIEEPLVLRFYDAFEVCDARGRLVRNPYADVEPGDYDGPVNMHQLPPGGTVTIWKYLNECVAFEEPGEYVVTARDEIYGPPRAESRCDYRCQSRPLRIRILPAPEKKVRDRVVADLKRLWEAPELRERPEYARYRPYVTEANGRTDALRLLAFRREQTLLPFWIARARDQAAFANEALAGLPDRAAVLAAIEARLAAGEHRRFLWPYTCLAVPKTDDVTWEEVGARRQEIRDRYAPK